MQRISISELSSVRWSFFQDVVRYAARGFNSLGVWRQKIDEFDELEALDLLSEMQMTVSSVHWAGGFTGHDGRSHVDAIDDALDAIHLASRLNAGCLIVHPGCRNGHTTKHAHRLFATALQTLLPVAEDYGVQLAIEPMPCPSASAWTFFRTFECSLRLLDEFCSDHLGLVLDLYHVGLNEQLFERLDSYVDRLALVQIADRDSQPHVHEARRNLGTGSVPILRWLAELQQLGYQGAFEVELHGRALADQTYHSMLNHTARFFQQPTVHSLLEVSSNSNIRVRRSSNQ